MFERSTCRQPNTSLALHHHVPTRIRSRATLLSLHGRPPQLTPARIHPLIQRHTHRIHLRHRPVEIRLEIPVRPKRLPNVSRTPELGMQLHGLEKCHVIGVKEHVPHRRGLSVDPKGVAGEDDAFGDDARRVGVEKGAHGNELRRYMVVGARVSIRLASRVKGWWRITHRVRSPTPVGAYTTVCRMPRVRIYLRRPSYCATGNVHTCARCWRLCHLPGCVGCRWD